MKKILVNAYVARNFGDDLFLKILFDRYPNVNWIIADYVISNGGEVYKKIFKSYKNVKFKNRLIYKYKILKKIKVKLKLIEKNSLLTKYDAGVYIGGSIFMQIPQWKEQYSERVKIINSFYFKNKPYFILGSNFGPYENSKFVDMYKDLFTKCKDVCFRDKYSYEIFKELENVRMQLDIVFQLKPQKVEKIKNSIGVSLIDLDSVPKLKQYEEMYIKKIRELIILLVDNKKTIKLFSFCEHLGDMKIIKKVINLLDEKYLQKIEIVNYQGDIINFLRKFEEMENIIGTRFHACILSQVFEQGLFPIIYSDKTYNALKDIDLCNEYIYINKIEELDVMQVLNCIDNNKINNKNILKQSEKQFEILDNYLL